MFCQCSDAHCLEDGLYLEELLAEGVDLSAVVDEHRDVGVEVAFVALDVEAFDVEAAMLEDGLSYLEQGAHLVGALYMDSGLEEVAALHLPSDSDQVVAKLALELIGLLAV